MSGSRTRDQRPCDNCRRRKIRCLFGSDEAVHCVLCLSRSTQCTYIEEAAPKKRRHSNAGGNGRDGGRPSQRSSNDDTSIIRDYSLFEGETLLRGTLGHQNRQSSSVLGHSSDFEVLIIQSLPFNSLGECLAAGSSPSSSNIRTPNHRTYFMMRPDSAEEMEADLKNLDAIEAIVAPYGPELVNLYFRIMHPSFPILHKKVFLEKHGRSYRESTPTGLGAVYLMALSWWSYSPTLSSKPKPDTTALSKLVLQMLFDVHQRPKISDLQGGLVLLQNQELNSWSLTGHLVAMAQTLGIMQDCGDWDVPAWERGVRKRVAWAVYMQDKWGALACGRPSNISDADWDVPPLQPSDFPETALDDDTTEGSADIETGRHVFMHMVSLTQILSSILSSFYTLSALKRNDSLTNVLRRAKPIQLRLKNWHAHLPKTLSIDDTKPRKLSSVGYLHLAYYTAEISIHRAILRSHTNIHLSSPSLDLILITRQAASTRFTAAISFIKRLKQEHFQSFWYFSSAISFAIVGVFGTALACRSLDEEERDVWRDGVGELRWMLRLAGQGVGGGGGVTGYAVGLLDALEQQSQFHAQNRTVRTEQGDRNGIEQQSPRSIDNISPELNSVSPGNGSSTISPGAADGMWTTTTENNGFDIPHLGYVPVTDMQHLFPEGTNGFAALDMSHLT